MIKKLIDKYDLLNSEIEQKIHNVDVDEIEASAREADRTLDEIIRFECTHHEEALTKFMFLVDLMKLEYFETHTFHTISNLAN